MLLCNKNIKPILSALFLTLFCYSQFGNCSIIDECGTYYVEGYLKKIGKPNQETLYLIVERQSNSEIRIDLGPFDLKKFEHSLGTNLGMDIEIYKPCSGFQCFGKVIKIKNTMNPYDEPHPFLYPRPIPAKRTECLK